MQMVRLCMREVLGNQLCSSRQEVQAIVARSENFSPCNGRNFDVIFVFVLGVSKCLKWPIRPNCSFGIVAICVPLRRMRAVAVIAFSCPLLPF